MPYKWKVQSTIKGNNPSCICVAYVDSRQVQDKLDDVCGPENWTDDYSMVGNLLICRIGIKINGQWVYKSDTGSESNMEADKGHVSDAFKRCAVKWGIGRFLYDLEVKRIPGKDYNGKIKPCDSNGNIFWDGKSLSDLHKLREVTDC